MKRRNSISIGHGLREFYRNSVSGNSNAVIVVDWDTRRFVALTLIVQTILWGTIALDSVGFHVPIIRQLVGFIYLTLLPGVLILRILRLHHLGVTKTLLFGTGLSLATLTFVGLLTNAILPYLGILAPLSLMPLLIVISAAVSVAALICYARDKGFTTADSSGLHFSPRHVLVLFLIPFLAIFGTYAANYYQTGVLLLVTVVVIGIVAILVGFDS